MGERVAVIIAEGTFGACSYVGEDERGSGLGGYSLQVHAVPGGDYRGEDAWLGAQFGVSVVSNTETIALQTH